MFDSNYIEVMELNPKPYFVESLRHLGYSMSTALADIIDNSIYAQARNIRISIDPNATNPSIQILDDGIGMTKVKLQEAMSFGSIDPLSDRHKDDLGRFGLGLKSASFSQCRQLTVLTRSNGITSSAEWDYDFIRSNNAYILGIPEVHSVPGFSTLGDTGTLVVWRKFDNASDMDSDEFNIALSQVHDELALIFHRFLSGEARSRRINIYLNEQPIEPFDPFNSSNPATIRSPKETINMRGESIEIQTFTLPHQSKTSQEEWNYYGGQEGYLKNQGFYIYRGKRLIIRGTWLGLARQTELRKLTRVRVDIPNSLDFEWDIDVKKSVANLPYQYRRRLRELIERMGSPSERTYTSRGIRLLDENRIPVWNRFQDIGEIYYKVDESNPVIQGFVSQLPDHLRSSFSRIMELVRSSLPFQTIFADMGGDPDKLARMEIADDDLKSIIETMYSKLQENGFTHSAILAAMNTADPFRLNWDFTLSVLEPRGNYDK